MYEKVEIEIHSIEEPSSSETEFPTYRYRQLLREGEVGVWESNVGPLAVLFEDPLGNRFLYWFDGNMVYGHPSNTFTKVDNVFAKVSINGWMKAIY